MRSRGVARPRPLASLLLLAAVIVLLPFVFTANFHLRVIVLVWIYSLAAIGLNLMMGYGGQVSLGHGAFLAIGAYTVAVGSSRWGLSPAVTLPGGVLVSAALAFVVGRPILRLKGHYLAVGTLGFGVLVFMALTNQVAWSGGPDGMQVVRRALFGWDMRGNIFWYALTGSLLMIGAWIALNLANSPTGLALRALRDSEIASSSLGVDIARQKLFVFVLSACYASVAGSLIALFNGHVTPGLSDFMVSVQLVTMVVLGGMGSVLGSVVGAALLVLLPQVLSSLHDYEQAFIGFVMVASAIFLRAGIVPSLARALQSRNRHDITS